MPYHEDDVVFEEKKVDNGHYVRECRHKDGNVLFRVAVTVSTGCDARMDEQAKIVAGGLMCEWWVYNVIPRD